MIAGTLEIQLLANMARLQKDMEDAKRAVGGAMASIEKSVSMAKNALGALGSGLSIGGLVAFAREVNNGIDALNDLKDATGSTIENISALEDVAARSGTSFETVSASMIKFNGILNSAKSGSDAELALKALGLDAQKLKEIDPADALLQTATAFTQFADDGNKARLMQELFGKSTKEVAAFLKDLAEKGQLVATVTTLQADEAERFNKELFAMGKNATDLARTFVGPMVTGINEVIKKFREGREAGKSFMEIGLANYWNNVRGVYGMAPANTGGASGSWEAPEPAKPSVGVVKSAAEIVAAAAAAKKALAEEAKLLKELEKAYNDLVKTAQTLANAKNAEADGIDAWFQAEEKARLATVKAANDSVQAAQDEYDNFGKTKSQIAEVTLARLNDKLQGVNAGTEIAASIGLQIDAQNRLIGILQKGEVRDASVEAAKDAAAEWKKTTDDIGRGLTDSLFRAFEAGKGFFSTLWSGIKNLFKTTALKLIINPVSTGITGAVSSAVSGAANAATSGGMLSNLSSANSLYSLASTGYAATLGSGVGAVFGATAGNAAIATAITGSASSATAAALAASQAAGTATAASATLASVGSSIAVAVPYIAAALAAAALISSLLSKKDSRVGGGYSYDFATGSAAYGGGPDKSFTGAQAPIDAINATVAGINGLLKTMGSSSSLTQYYAASETSNKGRGGVMSGGTLSNGVNFGEDNAGSNYDGTYFETSSTQSPDLAAAAANFATDLKQSMIQALQATTDIPDVIKGMVAGIDIELSDSAAVDKLLGDINTVVLSVAGFQQAVKTLPFAYLRDMSFDAAAGFIAAAGGLDALSSKLSSYHENFYSEEEKRAVTLKNITATVNAAGLGYGVEEIGAMSRAQFRALYEGAVKELGAGSPIAMALLNVNAEFASVTPAAEAAVVSIDGVVTSVSGISEAMKSLMSDTAGLQVELMRAQGNGIGADAAQYAIDTTGLSEAERAVFDYNASLRLQITALTDASATAAQLAADAVAAATALAATNQGWINQLAILTGAETERSIALRDAGDDSTRALMGQVYAQQDLKAATDAATAAATALAATNQGWINQLAILTGAETERSIALRDAGDDSTRAIMRQVYAQQDLKTAADAATTATRTALALSRTAAQDAMSAMIALYGDLAGAMLEISTPAATLVEQWRTSTGELTSLTQGLAAALGELPEATALDQLKATLSTLDSIVTGAASISEQIFALQTGKGDSAAIGLLQDREAALYAQMATSADPGAIAGQLATTTLNRIKLQGQLADKAINEAYKGQFDAATELARLDKTNRDTQSKAIEKQISSAQTLADVAASMGDYLAGLRFGDLSALNPGDQLGAAQGLYAGTLTSAQGGDAKAMQALQGNASSYLQEAQGYYGGATGQYAAIFQSVTGALEQFGAQPVSDIVLMQDQLAALQAINEASLALQTTVTDTTDLQIAGLASINMVLTGRETQARQDAADAKAAAQKQIDLLTQAVAELKAQIVTQAAIYKAQQEKLESIDKSLISLDNTSKQTAAAPA